MKAVKHITHVALAIGLGLMVSHCDSGSKKEEKPQGGGSSGSGSGSGEDDGTGSLNQGGSGGSGGDAVFATWCEKAAEIAPAKNQLKRFHEAFCANGKPTSLLTADLIAIAYKGSGDPKFKQIEKFTSDKDAKTTTGYLGVGIKLPISIKTHFDKVGPNGGKVESLKKLAEAQGAEGEASILKEYKEDGKYHVRGWKVRSKNTKDITIIKIVTETEGRSDQFMLEDGEAYAYTQYTTKSIQGIKDFSLYTAGVQIGDDAYLITQAYVVADNKGLKDEAESQIKNTAKALIKTMYKAAADAK